MPLESDRIGSNYLARHGTLLQIQAPEFSYLNHTSSVWMKWLKEPFHTHLEIRLGECSAMFLVLEDLLLCYTTKFKKHNVRITLKNSLMRMSKKNLTI